MLDHIDINKILFLDIETVPQVKDYQELGEDAQNLWAAKSRFHQDRENLSAEEVYSKAGIFAEFGKIVCISVGFAKASGNKVESLRIKSFFDHDEKKLLADFFALLDSHFNTNKHMLCGHNGKEFDFPYIARRGLINGLKLPQLLDIAGKKPWEVQHLDTMELWKFGDFKNYTSLSLLAHVFGIPTPKDDISGADVGRVYWEEGDIERIARYCEKDVVATIQLFQRFRGEELISDSNIEFIKD